MKHIIRTLPLACCCMQAQAQAPWKPDTELEKQLQQSNHVHRIMKSQSRTRRTDAVGKEKGIEKQGTPVLEDFGALRHTGPVNHTDGPVKSLFQAKEVSVWTLLPCRRIREQTGITPPRRLSVPSTGKTCGNTTAFPLGICGCTPCLS